MTVTTSRPHVGRASVDPRSPNQIPLNPRQTLVIPTFNERDNIAVLLARLCAVLPANDTEVIFVDDSTDDTPAVIAALAQTCAISVTLHHREHAVGGLGGAVVEGLRLARGEWVVVMDADLQHPPESVPDLVAAGVRDGADLVVASRYLADGSRDGLASGLRRWVSRASTTVAKVLFRRALHRISDPMSGFFAVRASSLEAEGLRPLGYKILLELVVRTRPPRMVEVPYTFQARHAGESKSSLREGLRFIRHLGLLKFGETRLRMLGVAVIGVSGLVPNLASLWLFVHELGLNYLVAAVLANQVALAWNLALVEILFRNRRHHSRAGRASRFFLLGNVDLVARIPVLALLVTNVHVGYIAANVVTLVGLFVLRFVVLDRVIYVSRSRPVAHRAVVAA